MPNDAIHKKQTHLYPQLFNGKIFYRITFSCDPILTIPNTNEWLLHAHYIS